MNPYRDCCCNTLHLTRQKLTNEERRTKKKNCMQFMETLSTPLVSLPIQANPEAPTIKSDNRNRQVFSLIEQCTSLRHLKQVHAHMLRTGLFFDSYSASKLFTACTLSPFSNLEYARKVFDEIPEPNLYTWNTLIRAHSWSPEPCESVKIFVWMLCESPYFPNKFTFPFLIKAATKLSRLGVGQVFHGLDVKSSFGDDTFFCFMWRFGFSIPGFCSDW